MLTGEHRLLFSSSCSDNTQIKIGAGRGRVVAAGRWKGLLRCQLLEELRFIHGLATAWVLVGFGGK